MITPQKNKGISIIQRFKLAYNIDPYKYQKKGGWKYLGYILLISYFTLLPQIFSYLLPYIHLYIPNNLIAAFGMFTINLIITLGYNLIMMTIYKIKHPLFQQFRVNHNLWPWQQNPLQWNKLFIKSILFIIINNVIIGVPLSILDAVNSKYLTSTQTIPTLYTILWQFTLFLLVQDCLFYWFHRLFHHPYLYWIHKHHHQYKNTIAFAAQSAHPLQGITGSSIPLFIGFKILSYYTGVHVITIWVFFTFRIIQGYLFSQFRLLVFIILGCDSHSGYQWGWGQAELLPFNSGSAYHSFHHSHNVGNYGSFFKFWDTLFGTNEQYIKYRLKLQVKQRQQLDKRAKKQKQKQQIKDQNQKIKSKYA